MEVSVSVGILVLGDNHFIVRGPPPDAASAIALARHWTLIRIGQAAPPALDEWQISSREFREDLTWAVIVPGVGEITPGVARLLKELSVRGIVIQDATRST